MDYPVVLICYPSLFSCREKFLRKMERITSALNEYSVLYIDDPMFHISQVYADKTLLHIADVSEAIDLATHAVIFDDDRRPAFEGINEAVTAKGIPLRKIGLKLTTVVNIDREEAYDKYIGRGSKYGNPYAIGHDGDRDEVIRKYKYDFDRGFLKGGVDFKRQILSLRGLRLGCHCKPKACHGDVLASYINSIDDGL